MRSLGYKRENLETKPCWEEITVPQAELAEVDMTELGQIREAVNIVKHQLYSRKA